jgi:hypothetical protein
MEKVNIFIYTAVGIVILLSVVGALMTPLNTALGNITTYEDASGTIINTGVPLTPVFSSNGIIPLVLMAFVVFVIIYSIKNFNKR